MIETLIGTALVMWAICMGMAPAWINSERSRANLRSRVNLRSRLSLRSRLIMRSRVALRSRLAFDKPLLSVVV
nr:hypothetical protein [uncultured Dongia sp.]